MAVYHCFAPAFCRCSIVTRHENICVFSFAYFMRQSVIISSLTFFSQCPLAMGVHVARVCQRLTILAAPRRHRVSWLLHVVSIVFSWFAHVFANGVRLVGRRKRCDVEADGGGGRGGGLFQWYPPVTAFDCTWLNHYFCSWSCGWSVVNRGIAYAVLHPPFVEVCHTSIGHACSLFLICAQPFHRRALRRM